MGPFSAKISRRSVGRPAGLPNGCVEGVLIRSVLFLLKTVLRSERRDLPRQGRPRIAAGKNRWQELQDRSDQWVKEAP